MVKLWCFREHWNPNGVRGPGRHGLADFAICGIVQSEVARDVLMAVGFLVADEDGGLLYLRWRFWRPSLFRRYAWYALRVEG